MVICAGRYTKTLVNTSKYIYKCSYRNFDKNEFINRIRNLNWEQVYAYEDIVKAVEIFTSEILNILDGMAPMKKI